MFRKALLLFLVGVVLTSPNYGLTLKEYLIARAQHRVTGAVTLDAPETVTTDRTFEICATVKGSASGGLGNITVMLEMADGRSLIAQTSNVPDWMDTGLVKARCLIYVQRKNELESPNYLMLMAIPDQQVAAWEKTQQLKPSVAIKNSQKNNSKPRYTNVRADSELASRGYTSWNVSQKEAYPLYSQFISKVNSRLSKDEVDKITKSILQFSVQYGVDARLIVAMVIAESRFNPKATSRAGAMGLGQLMPGTARGLGVSNPYDSEQNLEGAIRLLSGHMQSYGGSPQCMSWKQIQLAMAAYNAGAKAVAKYGGVPPYQETQNYTRRVISIYKKLCGIND